VVKTFTNFAGVELPVSGGSTVAPKVGKNARAQEIVQGDLVAVDVYGRTYDARVPVFISLNDMSSGLVIDRLVFDGRKGTGTSDYLVTVDSLIERRQHTGHRWGDREHSYTFPDPDNPPRPGDDTYEFWVWLQMNFPGWPNNGGSVTPAPGWGIGVPPLVSYPINNIAPSLSGDGFVGSPITLNDGSWTVNPTETDRQRRWFRDGTVDRLLDDLTQYTPVLADWGVVFTASVTVINVEGDTTESTSNSITVGGPQLYTGLFGTVRQLQQATFLRDTDLVVRIRRSGTSRIVDIGTTGAMAQTSSVTITPNEVASNVFFGRSRVNPTSTWEGRLYSAAITRNTPATGSADVVMDYMLDLIQ